jgi:hypothetical protein
LGARLSSRRFFNPHPSRPINALGRGGFFCPRRPARCTRASPAFAAVSRGGAGALWRGRRQLDVYDHFAWRYMIATKGQKKADQSLVLDPDVWQSKYFDDQGKIIVAQLRFWLSALP